MLRRSLRGFVFTVGAVSIYRTQENYTIQNAIQERKESLDRMVQNKTFQYSGVLVCERPSLFSQLWILNHFIPWHVYLEIPSSQGNRLVGLGQPCDFHLDTSILDEF